mmetsp:Transcript_16963/g.24865  ORF Transcript_16963/g.24865 Transcript_16963/m.24865 type:complete len:302 (-) Transcript_16963:90-995(-)|eukprot:CAMPEP_0195511570 /NCGR_PEP_ID=MMETSP0794_2-20130614/3849_1 /TAXON_ID=515487 /ORGANISM="Stephanopyxis turris, Strain CCMP 815" /LENGTH=301 /DNA_ID=CAMNT_0040639197 /DNA_START=28 /DNA_END=933 /DNA_ORIENTATION=+
MISAFSNLFAVGNEHGITNEDESDVESNTSRDRRMSLNESLSSSKSSKQGNHGSPTESPLEEPSRNSNNNVNPNNVNNTAIARNNVSSPHIAQDRSESLTMMRCAASSAATMSTSRRQQLRRQDSAILVAFGIEQIWTVPSLLLLCPFAGLVTSLAFLAEEEWGWHACLESRNVRRYVYGYQGAVFALLLFLAFTCSGDRLTRELFKEEATISARYFKNQFAVLILTSGLGLSTIENTTTQETSVFATALASYMIYAGFLQLAEGFPVVMCFAFIWNGIQLIVLAWVGGNKVDGEWTSNWQ